MRRLFYVVPSFSLGHMKTPVVTVSEWGEIRNEIRLMRDMANATRGIVKSSPVLFYAIICS